MNDDDRYEQAIEDEWHWYYTDLDRKLDQEALDRHHKLMRSLMGGSSGSEGTTSTHGRPPPDLDDVETAYQSVVAALNRCERLSRGIRDSWLEWLDEIDLQSDRAEKELETFERQVRKFARELAYMDSYGATLVYRSEVDSVATAIKALADSLYWRRHRNQDDFAP